VILDSRRDILSHRYWKVAKMSTTTEIELRNVLQTRKDTNVIPRDDEDAIDSQSDLLFLNAVTGVPDGECKLPLLWRAREMATS
jgi:hypothetical protein